MDTPELGAGVGMRTGAAGDGPQRFRVAGGFLQVVDNQVRVVTEQAEAV